MLVRDGVPVKAGTVDVSVILRVIDSTDGTPEPGVDHATAGIDLSYWREGGTAVAITEAALAALNTAHTDGGVEQIGAGYIRVDLPDAACAVGSTGVHVFGLITGMVVLGAFIPLVAYDAYDTVRLGLTALPNVAAAGAGGLITSAGANVLPANSIVAATIATDAFTAAKFAADVTTELQTGLATSASIATLQAFVDTEVAAILAAVDTEVASILTAANAIKAVTDLLPNAGALSSLATSAALATLQAFVDTEVAAILAAVDTEVAAIKAKTDSMTFTVAGQLDINLQGLNDVTIIGDGSPGNLFRV